MPSRWTTRLLLGLVLLLAAATRLANVPGVFVGGRVLIWDEDSAYHWHRASLAAAHYPKVHTFDWYTNYPTGARMMWPVGFDLALATAVRLVGLASGGRVSPLAIGVLFDPFLGVLSVLAIYFLGRELGGRAAGVAGAAIAAVLPILTGYSMVGRIDHHAVEPVLAALPLVLLLHGVRATSDCARGRTAAGLGALLAVEIGVWPGAIAAGVLVAVSLAVVALWPPRGCNREVFVVFGRRTFGAATLVILPVVLIHPWAAAGSFAYYAPTWLQPLVFATAWLSFTLAGSSLRRRPAGRGFLAAALVLAPLAVAATGVALSPGLRHTAGSVLGYLDRGDVQISQVFESYPLLSFGPGTAVQQYGIMAVAFPILLVALGLRCWRATPRGELAARVVLPWFAVTAGMALGQLRLGSQFAPLWCALWGAAWAYAVRRVEQRVGHRGAVRLGAVLVGLAIMVPTLRLHHLTRRPPQEDLVRSHDALVWLRERAATPGDVSQPGVRPRFAVMSRWEWGNWLITVAHQANIANPFSQAEVHLRGVRDAAAFFLATDPAQAVRQLERLGARYVLVTPVFYEIEDVASVLGPGAPHFVVAGSGVAPQPTPTFYATMNSRLLVFDGLEVRLEGTTLPPLRRLRLDFESAAEGVEPGWEGSFCKVFELVPGARIDGAATPGELADLWLYLTTNQGRRLTYHDRTTADAGGRFEFIVPYATTGEESAVRALGRYRITAGGHEVEVAVTEADVAQRRTVGIGPEAWRVVAVSPALR
jgi:asparagine N-glycosylation enzyme membrane subunit Stt3